MYCGVVGDIILTCVGSDLAGPKGSGKSLVYSVYCNPGLNISDETTRIYHVYYSNNHKSFHLW